MEILALGRLVSKKIGNNSLMNDELTPVFHVKSDVNGRLNYFMTE